MFRSPPSRQVRKPLWLDRKVGGGATPARWPSVVWRLGAAWLRNGACLHYGIRAVCRVADEELPGKAARGAGGVTHHHPRGVVASAQRLVGVDRPLARGALVDLGAHV